MKLDELLGELSVRGYRLRVVDQRLQIAPPTVPPDLLRQVRAHKEDLIRYLDQRPKPDSLEELRRFAPSIWRLARISDGRRGIIWGVTARGVLVSLGVAAPILTLNPDDVTIEESGAEAS